jgi:hypothetical protein
LIATPAARPAVAKKTAERGASQLMDRGPAPAATAQPAMAAAPDAATDPMELALLNSISVTDDDFQGLASGRGKAVREYLLQSGKVEGERLFLTEAKAGSLKTEGPRVYLQLQ